MKHPAQALWRRIFLGISVVGCTTITWGCGQIVFSSSEHTLFVDREASSEQQPASQSEDGTLCSSNPNQAPCNVNSSSTPTPFDRDPNDENRSGDSSNSTKADGDTTLEDLDGESNDNIVGETSTTDNSSNGSSGDAIAVGNSDGNGSGSDGSSDGGGSEDGVMEGGGDGTEAMVDGDAMGGGDAIVGADDSAAEAGDPTTGNGDGMAGNDTPTGGASGQSNGGGGDVSVTPTTTEHFTLDQGDGLLDLVFIVDNSISMLDEIARVKAQMADFIRNVKNRSDIRLMIISQSDSTTSRGYATLQIDNNALEGVDLVWINALVNSQQSLLIAALASCPASTNDMTKLNISYDYTICDRDLTTIWGLNGQFDVLNGALARHFRPNAKRVFVTITDDDIITHEVLNEMSAVPASIIDHTNINEILGSVGPHIDPYFFAFASLEDTENCDNYTPAEALRDLTVSSLGSFYDFCADDWTPYFQELANRVVVIANDQFQLLQATANRILSIRQGQRELPLDSFELLGSGLLKVDPSHLDPNAELTLEVTYEY